MVDYKMKYKLKILFLILLFSKINLMAEDVINTNKTPAEENKKFHVEPYDITLDDIIPGAKKNITDDMLYSFKNTSTNF